MIEVIETLRFRFSRSGYDGLSVITGQLRPRSDTESERTANAMFLVALNMGCRCAVLFIFQSVRCLDRLREQVTLFSSSSTSSQVVCFSLLALRFFVARSGSGSSILFRSSRLRKRVGVVRQWSCLAQSKNGSFSSFVDRSMDCTRSLHGCILLLFDALNGSALSSRGGSIPPDCAGFDCFISKDERFREERAIMGSRAV